ncbi:MAG: M24 family metallopeptidase [Bryobacteraceae bacterium]
MREEKLNGWLFFDHHQRDHLAYRILELKPPGPVTRRWYYYIPATGEPRGLMHRIESEVLLTLPGSHEVYSSWSEQTEKLGKMLQGGKRIAMQYSPNCAIFTISLVDAGTMELVRACGVEVVTSANLIQKFEATWTAKQLESHLEAGLRVDAIRHAAFELIRERTRAGADLNEYQVQQFIREQFTNNRMTTDHGPIVGVNENASNPHYEPSADIWKPIRPGDCVLIDLWAKLDQPDAVYYDITWTGFCGETPPEEYQKIFDVVTGARDAAIERVKARCASGTALEGYEVDDAARDHIKAAGYGEYFVHRTGHSIGTEVHGAGANMDNLETHDVRRVSSWTCFSIEPGVYLPQFGVRSEINMFIEEHGARVTGEIQQKLLLL